MKKILILILVTASLFVLCSCGKKAEESMIYVDEGPLVEEEMLLRDVGIVYTSDAASQDISFYAELASYMKEVKLDYRRDYTGLIDLGGAVRKDNPYSVPEIMNVVGYQASTLAGKDFLLGIGELIRCANTAQFSVLCHNLNREGESCFSSWDMRTYGAIHVAYIGYCDGTDVEEEFLSDENGFCYSFEQNEDTLPEIVRSIKAAGADYIVLMMNSSKEKAEEILLTLSDIDVLLNGGECDFTEELLKDKDGESVLYSSVASGQAGLLVISTEGKLSVSATKTLGETDDEVLETIRSFGYEIEQERKTE